MSEQQPTTDSSEPAPKVWRRPTHKAAVAVGGALAGVLLIAGIAYGGSDPLDELPAPPVKADPVPAPPLIDSHRLDCGVSQATLDTIVPDPEQHQTTIGETCRWSTADHDEQRFLDVSIKLVTDGPPTAVGSPGKTPVTTAMATFAANAAQKRKVKVSVLNGLGDEAMTFYFPKEITGSGSTVIARARNAMVTVTYRSGHRNKAMAEKTATDGALKAATDVIRGLGVTVNQPPSITDAKEEAAPARRPFKPCEMVSRVTLEKVIPEAAEDRGLASRDEVEPGKKADSCQWETPAHGNGKHFLRVSLMAHPSVDSAKDDYLAKHLDARAEEPISENDEKYFAALAGPGEQAYASFVEEGSPGGVVFRVGNVVATVAYAQKTIEDAPPGDPRPLSREHSINGAYAAAKDVAEALRN